MMRRTATIGLIELPELGLFDSYGRNRASVRRGSTLISKQVLLANLQNYGYDAQLVNLKDGDYEGAYGEVTWGGTKLTKVYVGRNIFELKADEYDIWGVTNNFSQHREVACFTIQHLVRQGKPVIVGGSDAIAEPEMYLQAGASAIITDKSGGSNRSAIEYLLGNIPKEELGGVILADGSHYSQRGHVLRPEDWALPSVEVARACLGTEYWSAEYPGELLAIGSVFSDIGCDRKCDFCQTPNYGLGYRRMSPQRTLEWLAKQKEAGARSVVGSSDQFMARVLREEGRDEILEIMKGARELGLAMLWPNGLELRKATIGRGLNRPGTDLTPDEELINAVWGWDGNAGTFHAYMPAERPLDGRDNYAKLLPWQEHCELLRAIVRSGLPALSYGIIIGFEDETESSLLRLEEAIMQVHADLMSINPNLIFQVSPFAISPIPGTGQGKSLRELGLLRFDDPVLYGGLWTPSVDTRCLSYERIAEWQIRLLNIGSEKGKSAFINTDFSPAPDAVRSQQRVW
ncbi:radical SAM protein [Crenothrix polyspora]|uniref:Fe-S oxidoreductase n=1 Tax=Crenothrix polyspora TaxID=360316 RepID=A0A1R4HJ63_9GAMM|nr:radical SAM protein [Crenothrix polyspora]SJM96081.1 Fe-S oxidoreductase [Crenothrix polyspora]